MRAHGSPGPALVVRHTGQTFPLTQAPVTIGREQDNTIVLADSNASRHHASVTYRSGTYTVQDLGSVNGTHINDRRVAGTQTLRPGDTIRIGNTFLEVHLPPGADSGVTLEGYAPAPPPFQPPAARAPAVARKGSPWLLVLIAVLVIGILVAGGALAFFYFSSRGESELPDVSLLSPAAGSQAAVGSPVTLQASATGADNLTRLEILVDGVLVAVGTSPEGAETGTLNATASWVFAQAGTHIISAQAYTPRGKAGEPVSVSLLVTEVVAQVTPSSAPVTTAAPSPGEPPTAEPPAAQPPSPGLPSPEPPSPEPPSPEPPNPEPTSTPSPTTAPPTSGPSGGGQSRPAAPGPITGFEDFGTWKRGTQANGTFSQSAEQVHAGSNAGKLAYNFPSGGNDFVVFTQTYLLGGRPNQISAWVYGDSSKHFLNVWIQDAAGETWQFPLGQVKHGGWQQMFARLDPGAGWPAGHIDGPSNGAIDYPINFRGLVFDDAPDSYSGSGTVYLDDLRCDEASAPPPTATPTATPQPASPVIQFWADETSISAGSATHLRWHVENVRAIYLDGDPVTGPDGSRRVRPSATTTYRLRVVLLSGGEETREVTIVVN